MRDYAIMVGTIGINIGKENYFLEQLKSENFCIKTIYAELKVFTLFTSTCYLHDERLSRCPLSLKRETKTNRTNDNWKLTFFRMMMVK